MNNFSPPRSIPLSREVQSTPARRIAPTNPFIEFTEVELEQSVPARFEQQVRAHPNKLAVKSQQQQFTYQELNAAANQVAWAIQARRGTAEEPIALLIEEQAKVVIAALGALKAGKMFVVLDPSFPPARLELILEDSQAPLILSDHTNLQLARTLRNEQVLSVHELEPQTSGTDLNLSLSPERLAYIVYTSGSTGQPKGVVHTHRSLLGSARQHINAMHLCGDDRVLGLTSPSFGTWSGTTFATLLGGGALFPLNVAAEGLVKLKSWLLNEEITIIRSASSVFRHLAATLDEHQQFPAVRIITLGGEPVLRKDVELYQRHFADHCLLRVSLASTEANTIASQYIDKQAELMTPVIPPGYVLDDIDVWLLDENGRDVDFDIAGEILVSAPHLAVGYWRKPELTHAAFVEWTDVTGQRVRAFRSGDLGRMHRDGLLEHLGRKDFQVKIRGQRVELAEVETAMLALSSVGQAAVVAREKRRGEKDLVAYVVPKPKSRPTPGELRRELKQRLPDFMIPSEFVMLDALPLTPSGKVDRPALTQSKEARTPHEPSAPRVTPTNPFREFKLAEVEQSIAARFEEQARTYPERLAIKTRARALTYDQLNRAANRVAHAILSQRGAGEEPVALLLEEGADAIVAILGALKAGKIYTPVDVTVPPARVVQILQDAQPTLIVSNNQNFKLAQEAARQLGEPTVSGGILNLDELDDGVSVDNPNLEISPERLACLFYTSGSTGQPKGIVQNHRNVLHFAMTATNAYHINAEDRQAILVSFSFLWSLSPIFGTLLNGATLLRYELQEQGISGLANWLVREEISLIQLIPALFRQLIQVLPEADEPRFAKLRLIVLGGEPAHARDAELWKKHFASNCILVHAFASSEASLIALYMLDKQTPVAEGILPIGYAAPDKKVELVDEAGAPVEADAIGEITIKSRYLATAYWRKPELTRAVFRLDPAGGDQRTYFSGDLGRMRADGLLEHLGRKDLQLKVRGHTVQVAEIEKELLSLDGVKEAVVVARNTREDEKELVAYLVATHAPAPTGTELRRALSAKLPDYMVPSGFVVLDALPLTPSGKVDRPALAARQYPEAPREPSPAPSSHSTELQLKEIWEKVLGVHPIGIKDNFFDLGGHSLLALRLFDEINKQFGHNLPLATLLERPTVTLLAELLREQDTQANWSSLVPIQTTGAGVPFFAVHPLGGHVLMYRDLAQQLQPLRPVYGLQALGLDGKSAPHSRVEEMAAHYIRELRRIQGEGPYLIGGFSSGGLLAFEMAQQLLAGGERVGLLALLDTGAPGFWHSRLGRSPRRLQFDNLVERVNLHRQRLSALSPNAKLPYLQTRASILYRRLVYKPEQTQLPNALLEIQRLHSQATTSYTVQRYPGRITLFRARKQPTRIDDDPTLGWRELARDGVDVHEVPGSHGWILVDPNVRVLARKLSQCLEQAQVNSRTRVGDTCNV